MYIQESIVIRLPLKHVGSKARQLNFLLSHFPKDAPYFFDLFGGLGTVGVNYALKNETILVMGDIDPRLGRLFRVLGSESDSQKVASSAKMMIDHFAEKHYYDRYVQQLRDDNYSKSAYVCQCGVEIFLNRCSYGGLWRVNKKGKYNTPYSQNSVKSFDDQKFLRFGELYRELDKQYFCRDYRETVLEYIDKIPHGCVFYFDPPYDGAFQNYTSDAFDLAGLELCCGVLVKKGHHVYVSQSCTDAVKEAFRGWQFAAYEAAREIGTNSSAKRTECLIWQN